VVSSKTVSSNIFNNITSYFSKNDFLNSISAKRIEDQKFNGIINIPPKQIFVKISLITHLYKSFTSYLSNNDLSFDLFLAKYGGFVIKYLFL
jgi:hypothetical protein